MRSEILTAIPTVANIGLAEEARVKREFDAVWPIVGKVEKLKAPDFVEIHQSDDTQLQERLLQTARINIVGRTTWARDTKSAEVAYERLDQTLTAQHRLYDDARVASMAEQNGSAMLEMRRDTAKLCFTAAAITGNNDLIQTGIGILDEVIFSIEEGYTPKDPTIVPLLIFERTRAARKNTDPGIEKPTLAQQHKDYQVAYKAAMEANNQERAATLAAWQTVDTQRETEKEPSFIREALLNFHETDEQHRHILRDQRVQSQREHIQNLNWNTSRDSVPDELKNRVAEKAGILK